MKQAAGWLFLVGGLCVPIFEARAQSVDWSLYEQKRSTLMTHRWSALPQNTVNKTMSEGPLLGNGDAAVICDAGTQTTQRLLIAKANFLTDDSRLWGSDSTSSKWDPVAQTNSVNWFKTERVLDPIPLPVGGISITVNASSASGYAIEQDILSGGEINMTLGTNPQVNIHTWLAQDTNLLVSELTTPSASPVSITVEVFAQGNNAAYPFNAGVNGNLAWATRQTKTNAITRWTTQAGISTRILGAAATAQKVSSSQSSLKFSLTSAAPVYVLTYISGGRPNATATQSDAKLAEAATYLNSLTEGAVTASATATIAWWKNFWTRSFVDLNDDLLNRYYYGIQYILGAAVKPWKVCPGLYGHWITTYLAQWHSDIHMDYNGHAPFYGVCSSNRPELILPFTQVI